MAEQITDTAFELIISEIYAGEIECQSLHHSGVTCSIKVTHWYKTCKCMPGKPICGNTARWIQDGMDFVMPCADCMKNVSDCWSIRPI